MNILIVDDEIRAVQALIRRIDWAEFGFRQPYSAYSMTQAQAIFADTKIDLMLCDIEMPQGNGIELFEWVKSYHPSTECIFVTCHDEYDYLRAAMLLGSCDYILKPINYDQLKDSLLKVADRLSAKQKKVHVEVHVRKPDSEPSSGNPYITKSLKYISSHLIEEFSITDLAAYVHLNEQYLMRLFKKELGCSILQYVTSERMNLAMYYLKNTDMTISEVALNCGFDNYSYFNRIFKRYTNETPAGFRAISDNS